MIKVGIEVPDEKFSKVDLSKPELGNPGVGGSEYLFTLLASGLKQKGVDVVIYHYSNNILPPDLDDYIVKDSEAMIQKAEENNIAILIHQVGKTKDWYHMLEETSIKSIAWVHVYLEYYELKLIRMCSNVKRVVFVGKEEYDAYIDDDVIKKSTYIFNMIPTKVEAHQRVCDKPVVTYVGSLVPAKGFHKLAEIWPEVIKRVPNAELKVIGNGKVYNRNAKLGKFGISQEDYEDMFMKYLTDDKGNILPSVHFMGIVGEEKIDIFKNTTVGIVNPTALTETFCMSAVEMEYAYIPVVSKKKWGLLDTIKNKQTGFLFTKQSEFIDRVVLLLQDKKLNRKMGKCAHIFAEKQFSVDVIIPEWIKLIDDISVEKPAEYHKVRQNWGNDYKWIKQVLRFVRFNLGCSVIPSFYDIKNKLKIILKKR